MEKSEPRRRGGRRGSRIPGGDHICCGHRRRPRARASSNPGTAARSMRDRESHVRRASHEIEDDLVRPERRDVRCGSGDPGRGDRLVRVAQ
ncbi:Hypothetical protein A7982_02796 [Minicystis rosea]|nr:Hypothetical protein A7982_02796 [Minicystis rosea]